MHQVTRSIFVGFLNGVREGTLPDSRTPGEDTTVAHYWRHLVPFLKWCKRRGYDIDGSLLEEDPFTGRTRFAIAQPDVDEKEPERWTPDEWEEIRRAAKAMGPREALAVEILLRTGVRLSEAVRINLGDVQGANIRVETEARANGGRRSPGVIRLAKTKGRKLRWPPISSSLQRQIQIYVERYRPDAPHERLFTHEDGTPMSKAGFQAIVKRLHRKADVKGGVHKYRHTVATEYLKKNPGQLEKLRLILGHTDYKTVQRYARLAASDLAEHIDDEDPFA